jgi:hypothetical protein
LSAAAAAESVGTAGRASRTPDRRRRWVAGAWMTAVVPEGEQLR